MDNTVEFYRGSSGGLMESVKSSLVPTVGSYISVAKKTWAVERVTWAIDKPTEHGRGFLRAVVELVEP